MAIHRVFESPRDRVIFDTGHQAYVHKMLTGRAGQVRHAAHRGWPLRLPQPVRVRPRHRGELPRLHLAVLRRRAGQGLLDPRRGPARRRGHRRRRAHRRHGLGGAEQHRRGTPEQQGDRRLVMVVNDNGRSYMPTVGGLANHLTTLRTSPRYEQILDVVKRRLNGVRGVGPAVYDALHAMKKGMKDALAPQGLFEDLGLKYVGPIDGHDRAAVEQALTQAKRFGGPVIVHVMTRKGFGYDPAERNEADQFHQIGPFDVETGVGIAEGPDLDRLLLRGDGGARRRAPGHRGDHGGDALPGGAGPVRRGVPRPDLRRRHRRAARRHQCGRPRDGRAAPGRRDLRHLPQPRLRPGADGRRPAPVRGHLRARPRRRHRRRRSQPQRDVGHVDPAGRPGPAAVRAPRRGPGGASCCASASPSTTPPPCCASPRGRRRPTSRRSTRPVAWTSSSATAPATCSSSGSARWPRSASRWPPGWPTRGSA